MKQDKVVVWDDERQTEIHLKRHRERRRKHMEAVHDTDRERLKRIEIKLDKLLAR